MRDEHGHMMAEATAGYQSQSISTSDADYDEAHADADDDKSDDKKCDCEKGVTEMTLKLVKRHARADESEQIRVRQGGLGGTVLFDSNDDGNSNPGLDLGDERTFTINNPGEDIVVTVYGKYHRNETVKARFETDCGAEVGEKDGNRYIKFKITDLKTDSDANACNEPEPEPEPECDCDKGAVEMSLKITSRSSSADPSERVRVRQNDLNGQVLFDSYDDGNSNPGLELDKWFTFDVASPGSKIIVTVTGRNHKYETIKGTFETDCSVEVGTYNGNSYIMFKLVDVKKDNDEKVCKQANASLGDQVWLDVNQNGLFDDGEEVVADVVVNLWTDDDGDGSPDTQINSTTTDASGLYSFTELDPGVAYVVQFVAPDGAVFTSQNVGDDEAADSDADADGITEAVTLSAGENNTTVDAGLIVPNLTASLGDFVWADANGDGVQDDTEGGIADVVVNLWTDDDGDGAPDTQIDDTTTAADGSYGFADLDPTLTYVVQFVAPAGTDLTVQDVGDDATDSDADSDGITGPITLAPGENNPTIDAGLVTQLASLGDFVWADANSDGVQDDTEGGIADVVVNLWTDDDGDGAPDTQIDDTTTAADGSYSFAGLDPSLTYVVQFVAPAGTEITTQDVGDDATDSDADSDGITGPITLAPGENNPTIDAGLVTQLASLGDFVWADANGDGVQDDTEGGIAAVVVNLWTDDDGDGTPDTQIDDTTTAADGSYSFAGLDPSLTYVVQFVAPAGTDLTVQDVGDDATDSDADADGITGPITLAPGENNPTIDAGVVTQLSSLGDFVWVDENRDGVQDDTEGGIADVVVNLWTDDDGDGAPDTQLDDTTTAADGSYSFTGLDPSLTYVVQFVAPAGSELTLQDVGDDATDSDADADGITGPITLAPGENNPTIDAGIVTQLASLGDFVWGDANRDGVQDDTEAGIADVVVNLWTDDDGDGTPDTQVDDTTTAADGSYSFTLLDPSLTYVVQFVAPASSELTLQDVGDDSTDSDADANGITGPITLEPGGNNPTIDAGIVTQLASLGDFVWTDANRDGVQDDTEAGLADVVVNLWTDDDGDGTPDTQVDDTTTAADGSYNFTLLDPSLTYVVQFVAPTGSELTLQDVGDDATDSDADANGVTAPITLAPGENNPTIDAGIVTQLASLGDFVWTDANRDGIQDDTEAGLADVVVNLWTDDDGNGTPDTQVDDTTTAADGSYSFTELDPSLTYVVQFVAPAGTALTTQDVGDDATDSDADANGVTAPITLAPGENNPTIDAGIVTQLASLGDFVWADTNRDGIQDDTEVGVADVVVNLWTDDDGDGAPDAQIDDTATAADGSYSFTELDPSLTYIVQFVAPTATELTTQNVGDDATDSDANQITGVTGPITLAPGENNPTIDAGIVTPVASLGDFVWADANRDGVQDDTEVGVADVVVNLWTDDDGDGTPDTQIDDTATAADGSYSFTELDPSLTYIVEFVAPTGLNLTLQDVGNDAADSDADPATGITGPITLAPGDDDPTIDAGIVEQLSSLGDFVWIDNNLNGLQDDLINGQPTAVEGMIVNLLVDVDGDGAPDGLPIKTTATDSTGLYEFTELDPALTYIVQFARTSDGSQGVPAYSYSLTLSDVAGGDDSLDSDANQTTGITGPINLAPGEYNSTIDAGVVPGS